MRKTIGKLFLILMLLVIYAPILILAVYSFTDSGNIGSIHGFSMQNYVTLFTKGELRDNKGYGGRKLFARCLCQQGRGGCYDIPCDELYRRYV